MRTEAEFAFAELFVRSSEIYDELSDTYKLFTPAFTVQILNALEFAKRTKPQNVLQ